MVDPFCTLQEFLAHTNGVTYILMVVFLLALLIFWNFLIGKDEDE